MLYTRFVIGEETLSSTSFFNFSHCAIFSITISSFILSPDVVHYRPNDRYLVAGETSSGIVPHHGRVPLLRAIFALPSARCAMGLVRLLGLATCREPQAGYGDPNVHPPER